jgi:hypothetical protein
MKREISNTEAARIVDEYNAKHRTPAEIAIERSAQELPDCACGWSGKGTGPGGCFVKGDRCPNCGESLF